MKEKHHLKGGCTKMCFREKINEQVSKKQHLDGERSNPFYFNHLVVRDGDGREKYKVGYDEIILRSLFPSCILFPWLFLQFLSNKEEEQNEQEELKKKLMDAQKGQVKCRLCKEDHWTKQCPYKDKLEPLRSSLLVRHPYVGHFTLCFIR